MPSAESNAQPFVPRAPANPCPDTKAAAPTVVPGRRKAVAGGPPDFKKVDKAALVYNLKTLT